MWLLPGLSLRLAAESDTWGKFISSGLGSAYNNKRYTILGSLMKTS